MARGVDIDIELKGTEALQRKLKRMTDNADTDMSQALEITALDIQRVAKRLAPVDTGRLQNSIAVERGALKRKVGTNVEYAEHQEFGTRYQSGTPFLRPAWYAALGTGGANVTETVQKQLALKKKYAL